MNDTPNPTAWVDMWADAQRKYMDVWANMLRTAQTNAGAASEGAARAESNPLAQGMDFWSKMALSAVPEQGRELTERYFNLGKNYLQMAEGLWGLMQQTHTLAEAGGDWQKGWQQQLAEFQKNFSLPSAHSGTLDGLGTFWGMPLQHWRQLVSSLSALPGDLEKALRDEGPAGQDTFQRALRSMVGAPALGYTREWQEDAQKWLRLSLDYAQALQAYEAAFGKANAKTFEMISGRLTDMIKSGTSFDSLRDAYNACVDCAETAYGEMVSTGEFAGVQAGLMNAMLALKKHEQLIMSEMQGVMNIPTRRELNTTHCRVQEMRREIRTLRHRIEDLEEIAGGVEELREQVRNLQPATPARRPATRGNSARKAAPATAGDGEPTTTSTKTARRK